jgi:hypothetical protein
VVGNPYPLPPLAVFVLLCPGLASVGVNSGPASRLRKRLERRDSASSIAKSSSPSPVGLAEGPPPGPGPDTGGAVKCVRVSTSMPDGCGSGGKVRVVYGSGECDGAGGESEQCSQKCYTHVHQPTWKNQHESRIDLPKPSTPGPADPAAPPRLTATRTPNVPTLAAAFLLLSFLARLHAGRTRSRVYTLRKRGMPCLYIVGGETAAAAAAAVAALLVVVAVGPEKRDEAVDEA